MDAGSVGCVVAVAALGAVGFMAWRMSRVAESASVALGRMADAMAKLAHSRPWRVIERTADGGLNQLDGEGRGEFPVDRTTTVHRHTTTPTPPQPVPQGLEDPLARPAAG